MLNFGHKRHDILASFVSYNIAMILQYQFTILLSTQAAHWNTYSNHSLWTDADMYMVQSEGIQMIMMMVN